MITIISVIAQYVSIILLVVYAYLMFAILQKKEKKAKNRMLTLQLVLVFIIHFLWYLTLFLRTEDKKLLLFYGVEILICGLYMALYHTFYPDSSRLLTNNMCLLLLFGYTMLTRINKSLAIRQFVISTLALIIVSFLPLLMMRVRIFRKYYMIYGILGIVGLLTVFIPGKGLIHGVAMNGARNWIHLGTDTIGISFQPSEVVKILFIFFVASAFSEVVDRKRVLITTGFVVVHLGILVIEKDLGAALIYFIIYITMLYIATRRILYPAICVGGAAVGGVLGFLLFKEKLFNHVMIRIQNWLNPWEDINNTGYQIAQSLFAIGSGGWFGSGLMNGMPQSVPVRESDFIFAIIAEEMGLFVGFVLILIYFCIFLGFILVSMNTKHSFYKNMAFGFAQCFVFQVILNIGGATKFIPSTGVTLPLVSYGLSSVVCTLIIFQIIQGIQIITAKEGMEVERRKEKIIRSSTKAQIPNGRAEKKRTQ